ncbi:MAG: hypothetical protein OHK005_04690 [Candidatus Methylacidiphilales bacterium]
MQKVPSSQPNPTNPGPTPERKGKITVPFITSVLLHGGILVLLGGAVLVPGIIPKAPFVGEMVVPSALESTEEVPIDDFLTEDPVAVDAPQMEMPETVPSAPSAEQTYDVIATATMTPGSTFSLPIGTGIVGAGTASFGTGSGTGTGQSAVKPGRGMKTFFGSSEVIEGGLTGTFYDLKRLRNGNPAPSGFVEKIREFTDGNWRPSILNKYYSVSRKLFATQFYIPLMPAEEAPKAFEVEKEVQPKQWVINYTGQFSPPVRGKYRFVGYADDLLIVRVDNKVVLNGSRNSSQHAVAWTPDSDGGARFTVSNSENPPSGGLIFGNWLELNPGTNYSINVLIGENPGGEFCAFLFVEQEGRTYKKAQNGRPLLPLFRTAREGINIKMKDERSTPSFDNSSNAPVFAPAGS